MKMNTDNCAVCSEKKCLGQSCVKKNRTPDNTSAVKDFTLTKCEYTLKE